MVIMVVKVVAMRQPGERTPRYPSAETFHSVLHELRERDAHLLPPALHPF
jgi:hypothetical protein